MIYVLNCPQWLPCDREHVTAIGALAIAYPDGTSDETLDGRTHVHLDYFASEEDIGNALVDAVQAGDPCGCRDCKECEIGGCEQ